MRIFISSTFKDLQPQRQAAIDSLRRSEVVPWGMEVFVSESSMPLEVALRELRLSDAVVLIIGFKAGSLIPESPDLTYTAAEFRSARELVAGQEILPGKVAALLRRLVPHAPVGVAAVVDIDLAMRFARSTGRRRRN